MGDSHDVFGAPADPDWSFGRLIRVRFVIVRHGQSTNNHLWSSTGDDVGRAVDPQLTDLGHEQAAALAAYVGETGLPWQPTHLYASAMVRAVQTAAPLADVLELPLRLQPDLHEVFGPYDYLPGTKDQVAQPGAGRAELAGLSPRVEIPDWVTDDGWWDQEVEHRDAAFDRADRLIAWAEAEHASDDVVVLVSHGWFGNVLLARLLGIESMAGAFEIANTALTLVEAEDPGTPWGRSAVRVNWMPHLTPAQITDSAI